MVDSINNTNGVQGTQATSRTQARTQEERRNTQNTDASAPIQDEVSISNEALSLAQAEDTARETRTILEQQLEETLSGNRERLNALL